MGKKCKTRRKAKAKQPAPVPIAKGKCIANCGRAVATGRSYASRAAATMGLCGSCYRDKHILAEFRARELVDAIKLFLTKVDVLKQGEDTLPALNRHCGRLTDEMRELKKEVDLWTESIGQRLAYEVEITAKLRELRKRIRKAINSGTAALRRAAKERQEEMGKMGIR